MLSGKAVNAGDECFHGHSILKVMDLSVLMAVYNQADTVNAAMKSILGQSFADFELVVVDDHSTDETALILKQLSLKDLKILLAIHLLIV